MNKKRIWTVALLAFVAYSLVVLVAKRYSGERAEAALPEQAGDPGAFSPGTTAAAPRFIVYYFHGRERCETCRNLEAYAKEAVETAFAEPLSAGRMAWRVVDFSKPADAHFDTEFELGGVSSVAVAELHDGKPVRKKVLDEGLMLSVTGTKVQVTEYVEREVRAFVENK